MNDPHEDARHRFAPLRPSPPPSTERRCRVCAGAIEPVLSLGDAPLANALLEHAGDVAREARYPLDLFICHTCTLLQLGVAVPAAILFAHYFYVTPRSEMLALHYREIERLLGELGVLSATARVVEIGSNSGELLRHLRPRVGQVLGVEPATNVARLAVETHGVPTLNAFFDAAAARQCRARQGPAEVIVARHCLAHIDDLGEVMAGVDALLADDGVLLVENAYVFDTLEGLQVDQIYHEHMSYLGVTALKALVERHGLRVVEARRSPVHGGSILVFAARAESRHSPGPSVLAALERERRLLDGGVLERFVLGIDGVRRELVTLIDGLVAEGKTLCTYGATAKGNTLLHFCDLGKKELLYCLDSTPIKQGKLLPGSGIEIVAESELEARRPDYCLLTAWNYQAEILAKQRLYRQRGGQFIIPLPVPAIVQ